MEDFKKQLFDNLKLLSSTSEVQLSYLESIGDAPIDELALEFDEVMLLVPQMVHAGEVTPLLRDSINLLNTKLNQLSDEKTVNYWTEQSLVSSAEWEEIRVIAGDCLANFGQVRADG